MTKPTIYVILAPSRSGKDTLAKMIMSESNCRLFKWAAHVKRTVERTYGLRPYDLELDEVRNSCIPGTTITYLDILVDMYHLQDSLKDVHFWKRPALATLEQLMTERENIISTDTRDGFEVEAINNLSYIKGYFLVVVKLQREGNEGLSTDTSLEANYKILASHADKCFSYTVPSADDYERYLVPIALELVKLAH